MDEIRDYKPAVFLAVKNSNNDSSKKIAEINDTGRAF